MFRSISTHNDYHQATNNLTLNLCTINKLERKHTADADTKLKLRGINYLRLV